MPVFDEQLEAHIERVRICYRLSGRNKGTIRLFVELFVSCYANELRIRR